MNKLVKIEELQEGDEIIVGSGSTLKYLKLLKNPTLSNKVGWKRKDILLVKKGEPKKEGIYG